MGRVAASRGEIRAALDELEFHWGSAYHIAVADGMYTAQRLDGKGVPLTDPFRLACCCGSRLTTRRCRCRGTCRDRPANGPATAERDPDVPGLRDAGPAAVHDLHPGTGPPGGHRIRLPGVPAAHGRVRRAAMLSGPARPGAEVHAVRYREDKPDDLARARAAVAAWRGQNPGGTSEQLVAAIGH